MTVRPAAPADLAAIMGLETAAFTGGWSERSWADEVRDHFVLVAEEDRVVGVLAMSAVAGTAEVLRIIVDESVRRTGHGRALLCHGLAWAQTVAGQVFLEVSAGNQAAISMYESEGFRLLDRRSDYYGPGDDALVYRLDHTSHPTHSTHLEEETCQSR